MKVIIGSYRGPDYTQRALRSLGQFLHGWDELVIVDDSGNQDWIDFHRGIHVQDMGQPLVIDTLKQGYNAAMKAVCEFAGDEAFFFFEEDFILLEDVDLTHMKVLLEKSPHLAQIALLRDSHFPIEFEYGGLLPALDKRIPGSVLGARKDGLIEQTGCFTCNPSVWAPGIAAKGWPDGKWSEDLKRDELLAEGYNFAYLPGVKVKHDGPRIGKGY